MTERFVLSGDYSISRVINGCWQLSQGHSLGGPLDRKDVLRAFHELVDRGFTTFDCADIYTGAEAFLGEFLRELRTGSGTSPEAVQIHTKYVPDIDQLDRIDFAATEKVIDRSLKRLGRDVLDIVQFHWWDYTIKGCVETAGFLRKLQEKGKIRFLGVTNFDREHLEQLITAGIPILTCQSQYSLFDRRPEKELLDYCQSHGIYHFCYGTLAGGLAAAKYMGQPFPEPETRSQVKYLQVIQETFGWEGWQDLLQLLATTAQKHGVESAHVAVQYILRQPGVAAAIIGVRSSQHTASNSRIFDFSLKAADMAAIGNFLQQYPVLPGQPFELERTAGSRFRSIMKMNLSDDNT